jgi:F-type H+-transporting ATPase subunit a
MSLAYAASQSGEHGAESNIGDVILHHVLDTTILDIRILGINLSITKHVLMMWIAAALLIIIFRFAFRAPRLIPSGVANLLEAIIVFLRDEVILPNMGEEGRRYLPYLLTVFFFILFCNLLGLIPFAATATGNVSVTAALAIMSLVMIQVGGIREHGLKHHVENLIPHGIPVWLLPIMIPVEIMGQFTKPFALCIRLFANMTAGHIVILSFLCMIFILKSIFISPVSVFFALFISLLELFVAFLQAYIFTMLTSLFIGMSIHPQH